MSRKIVLTGDRPTGPLHIGHLAGSLQKRLELQDSCDTYIMIADAQAIPDNVDDINKIRTNIFEVACDYLAVGLSPEKCCIFIQSTIPQLPELAMYYLNLVTIERIGHNPTVKQEVKSKSFKNGVPAGFYLYPLYQVADITAFQANFVPVGKDQTPMIELTRDIVRKFNDTYKTNILIEPQAIYSKLNKTLPGIDGQKMSKSLGNAIYLSDEEDIVIKKIKKIKSDPLKISVDDCGDPDNVIAFTYLDIFDKDIGVVNDLKNRYRQGGLPDRVVKDRLIEVLLSLLKPIRENRKIYHSNRDQIYEILKLGTNIAIEKAKSTLNQVKSAIGISYY